MSQFQLDKEKQTIQEDAGIQAEAWMALWKADDLRSLDINSIDIEVHDGDVWLTGHVVTAYRRLLAENLVKAVTGVNAVHNELVADSQLVIDVAQALAADERTRPYIIPVGTFHGWVHLGGQVPTKEVRSAAEMVAASVPTVRGVVTLPQLPNQREAISAEAENGNYPIQPQIGDRIYARDGLAGKVAEVIISPRNRLVTYVVLATDYECNRRIVHSKLLIPTEAVINANQGSLFLHDSLCDLEMRPVFEETDFPRPSPEWRPPYPYTKGTVRCVD